VPGMSSRPGNFDTTGALFNPQADNGRLDPLTTPSLRGARFLAPYGHDGRNASLRDFVRAVIVGEFAGPEPSARILDALVTYIQEIDFLPNPRLGPMGRLAAGASEAERRGEALFGRPFPHDAAMSCAGCHVPGGAFVDHAQHDVGTGGLYKTPTLINANFNAPYFHDGRFDTYGEVVDYFVETFALGFSAGDRADLVAYLGAVGDGTEAYEPANANAELVELETFDRVLARALASRDAATVALAVDTIGGELRELEEFYPARKDTSVAGGLAERSAARAAIKELVLNLRRVESAASAGRFDAAGAELASYRAALGDARVKLEAAAPWSLYNPTVRQVHDDALRRLYAMAAVQSAP
jgi:di-heme cytochrome c peroxidase